MLKTINKNSWFEQIVAKSSCWIKIKTNICLKKW